jgi:hypothetical protein
LILPSVDLRSSRETGTNLGRVKRRTPLMGAEKSSWSAILRQLSWDQSGNCSVTRSSPARLCSGMRFHVSVVKRTMNYRLERAGDVGAQRRPDRRPRNAAQAALCSSLCPPPWPRPPSLRAPRQQLRCSVPGRERNRSGARSKSGPKDPATISVKRLDTSFPPC